MLTIALTGGIGCGKSEVSHFFSALGSAVIDTDLISRQLVTPGSPALEQITRAFGDNVLLEDGNLDRSKMRELVFNDSNARQQLENILHPLIQLEVSRQIDQLDAAYVIIVIPLLLETSQQTSFDRVLVVDCSEKTQQARVLSRDNIDQVLLDKILSNQATRQARLDIADDVISNDSSLADLQKQVNALHAKYLQLARQQSGQSSCC